MAFFPGRRGRAGSGSALATVLVVLVALLAVGGTAWAYLDFRERVDSTVTDSSANSAADDSTDQSSNHSAGAGQATGGSTPGTDDVAQQDSADDGEVVSLWLGDGYTAGTDPADPQTSGACQAARRLGWTCELDAEFGTGFVNDGTAIDPLNTALLDRLTQTDESLDPDVVVLDAGRNDLGVYALPAIEQAISTVLERAHRRFPDATLVQVVPWTLTQEQPATELASFITDEVAGYDGYVVDPVAEGWAGAGTASAGEELRRPAGGPDEDGQAFIGRHLARSLRTAGVTAP